MIVLVVEDDGAFGCSFASLLMNRGHLAGWNVDARGLLTRLALEQPDAVLLDWCLPDADGRTLLPLLLDRGVRVVVLTALASDELQKLAEQFPGVRFLQKPVEPSEAIRLLEEKP